MLTTRTPSFSPTAPWSAPARSILPLLLLLFLRLATPDGLQAQHPHADARQVEIGVGIGAPFLQGGTELLRARAIRDEGRSYFAAPDGSRRAVGGYSALLGFSLHLSYQDPVSWRPGLLVGAAARFTLSGSQPSEGGYDEGYFFNSVTLGLNAKGYPWPGRGAFVRGEAGLGATFTKDRFRDEERRQGYHHQFGIGPAGALGAGYTFGPLRGGHRSLDVQALYQQLRSRVEVNGLGDDPWTTGALHLMVTLNF